MPSDLRDFQGPISVDTLTVSVTNASSDVPLLTVEGVATIGGNIVIDVSDVKEGDSLPIINATEIVGNFNAIDVTVKGKKTCARAKQDQGPQTLVALLYVSQVIDHG